MWPGYTFLPVDVGLGRVSCFGLWDVCRQNTLRLEACKVLGWSGFPLALWGVSLEKRLGVGDFWLFSLGPRMNMCERSLSLICSLQPLQPIYKSNSEGQRCCRVSQSSACSTALPLNNQPCAPPHSTSTAAASLSWFRVLLPQAFCACSYRSLLHNTQMVPFFTSFRSLFNIVFTKRISRASVSTSLWPFASVYFSPWYSIIQRTC